MTMCVLFAGSGCHRPSYQTSRIEAKNQWNQVRARIKQQLAQQQFDQGLFQDAIANATAALALSPTLVKCYVLIAFSHLELGQSASAEAAINRAGSLGLEHSDLHYIRAVLLEQRGDVRSAVKEFARARELDKTRIEYLLAHAECLATLGRYAKALTLLAESLNTFDDSYEVATLAARVAELKGDRQLAIEYDSIALARGSSDPLVSQSLGLDLAMEGRCRQAIETLSPLLDGESMSKIAQGAVRRSLAGCLLKTGQPRKAFEIISGYSTEHPQDDAAAALHAAALWKIGEAEKALRALPEHVGPGSATADLLCLRGDILSDLGREKEASEAFSRALADNPGHFRASQTPGRASP